MAGPERALQLWSPLPPEALIARLAAEVEADAAPMTLVWRVSGAGVVARSLRAPATTRPLFGKLEADRFRLAVVPTVASVNAFQPILRGALRPDRGGTALSLDLRPHPDARGLIGVFLAFGALLVLISAMGALKQPGLAAVGYGFAALAALVPTLKLRLGFARGCDQALAVLGPLLALQPAPVEPP